MTDLATLVVDIADEPYMSRVTVGELTIPSSSVEIQSGGNNRSSDNYLVIRVPMYFVTLNAKPATGYKVPAIYGENTR